MHRSVTILVLILAVFILLHCKAAIISKNKDN